MSVNGSTLDTIAVNDRGFSYGDGLFETIRLYHHYPILLNRHLDRLESGARRLKIALDRKNLEQEIDQVSKGFPEQGVLKIVVTRGTGGRGYRPSSETAASQNGASTTRVITLHSLPEYGASKPEQGISAFVCKQRLALQPALAGIKHLNRLEQVLASMEWPEALSTNGEGFMEGIMLDMEDNVIEGTRSNIFWGESGKLYTPSLERCGVEGIMRNTLLENISDASQVSDCSLERLLAAEEVFVCNSVFGIWPVNEILTEKGENKQLPGSKNFSLQARQCFEQLLNSQGDQ